MRNDTPDILKKILRRKAQEISERAAKVSMVMQSERASQASAPRGFADAIAAKLLAGQAAVIAEIKRASPSKGLLRDPFVPGEIAADYAKHGAAALSVLTDRDFFKGDDAYLSEARNACALPVLRKEFIIDAYQVYEARALGADCILLIVAALGDALLSELYGLAVHLNMDVLVEVHTEQELERALDLDAGALLGINNRDLHTFDTSLNTTLDLLKDIPPGRTVVTESGIHTQANVAMMREHGVHAFLVGEAFMRADSPGARLAELFPP